MGSLLDNREERTHNIRFATMLADVVTINF
jgi:hypothetical protein